MREALLLIDIQNDYFAGGKSELHNPLLTLENTENIPKNFNDEMISAELVHKTFMAALNGMFAKVMTAEQYQNN